MIKRGDIETIDYSFKYVPACIISTYLYCEDIMYCQISNYYCTSNKTIQETFIIAAMVLILFC